MTEAARTEGVEIDRLLLVAGPSGAGKSTFIENLTEGRLPRIARQLDFGDPASWQLLLPRDLPRFAEARRERVILHYDFLQSWSPRRNPIYAEEGALRILGAAAEVTLVTLWAPAGVLAGRIARRRTTFLRSLLVGKPWNSEALRGLPGGGPVAGSLQRVLLAIFRELRRLGAKRRLYRRSPALAALYAEWLRFCAESGSAQHWIFDASETSETSETTMDRGAAGLLPGSAWSQRS